MCASLALTNPVHEALRLEIGMDPFPTSRTPTARSEAARSSLSALASPLQMKLPAMTMSGSPALNGPLTSRNALPGKFFPFRWPVSRSMTATPLKARGASILAPSSLRSRVKSLMRRS